MKNTRNTLIAAAAVLVGIGASVFALPFRNAEVKPAPSNMAITGDYVEARTCSVFAGACHYNGELMTTGRDVVMAWNFSSGTHNGVNLAGVRVAAAITSQENLSDPDATHKTEIVIDPSATSQQVEAVVSLLQSKCGEAFGTIAAIRHAPVAFTHTDKGYAVNAVGFATLAVQYMPDNACCVQPGNVWYSPLSPTQQRKVGFTEFASYNGTIAPPWYRSQENGAFYGSFTF